MQESSRTTWDYLKNQVTFLDARIEEIKIFSENEILNISVTLITRSGKISILFEDVVEYNFYHNKNYIFYNVEDYKFLYLNSSEEFYISFDPDQSTQELCEHDGDFIRAKKISLVK